MSTDQTTPAGKPQEASTRHHVVDGRYAALLADDFGLDWAVLVEALIGEPQKQAIAICCWAEGKDDPKGALLAWSKKHRKGTHRPRRRSCRRPSDNPTDTALRRRSNTDERRRATTPPGSGSIGFGYGVGKATVMAGLERMGS